VDINVSKSNAMLCRNLKCSIMYELCSSELHSVLYSEFNFESVTCYVSLLGLCSTFFILEIPSVVAEISFATLSSSSTHAVSVSVCSMSRMTVIY